MDAKQYFPISDKDFIRLKDYQEVSSRRFFETVFFDEIIFNHAIDFYNEYFKYDKHRIDFEIAVLYGKLGVRLNADLFKSMLPMDEEGLNAFYSITPFYFFHDVLRFMDGIHIERVHEISETHKPPVLDFGGGTGGYSIALAQKGWNAHFYDSNRMQFQWMKYINKKLKLDITVHETISTIPKANFMFILAEDIAEHVINPSSLFELLSSFLTQGGKMTFSQIPCCGPDDTAPMHFPVDLKDGKYVSKPGLNIELLKRTYGYQTLSNHTV